MANVVFNPPPLPSIANSETGKMPLGTNPVGIIIPPADLRTVIEKTASFVGKFGAEIETRIRREEHKKLEFLAPNSPYRPYYDMKLKEIVTGIEPSKPAMPEALLEMKKKEEAKKKDKEQLLALTMHGESFLPDKQSSVSSFSTSFFGDKLFEANNVEPIAREPEKDVFSVFPPLIAPVDIDVIKTAAQFVARNGHRFLVGLSQRERNNPQFDFLKPAHALFGYFTSLVEAYTRCLMPHQNNITKLKSIASDEFYILPLCYARYKWQVIEEKKKEENTRQSEMERAQMQAIDWHDFVVVETIEFTEEDETANLAVPIDFSKLSVKGPRPPLEPVATKVAEPARTSLIETIKDAEEDMEMDEDEERLNAGERVFVGPRFDSHVPPARAVPPRPLYAEVEEEIPLPVDPTDIKLVRGYVWSKRKRQATDAKMSLCPITNQLVPAEEMSKHLKILLLDPQWKNQKEKLLEKAKKDSAFADMEDLEGNLASFVANRPDLFGSVEDEMI